LECFFYLNLIDFHVWRQTQTETVTRNLQLITIQLPYLLFLFYPFLVLIMLFKKKKIDRKILILLSTLVFVGSIFLHFGIIG